MDIVTVMHIIFCFLFFSMAEMTDMWVESVDIIEVSWHSTLGNDIITFFSTYFFNSSFLLFIMCKDYEYDVSHYRGVYEYIAVVVLWFEKV